MRRRAAPSSHVAFLASLRSSLAVGRYFLCHAGVRPGVPLARQREEDLLWIRDEFLDSKADFGKVVVHGHTPTATAELKPNRVNVDTGAFISGRLTCAVLEEDGVRLVGHLNSPDSFEQPFPVGEGLPAGEARVEHCARAQPHFGDRSRVRR